MGYTVFLHCPIYIDTPSAKFLLNIYTINWIKWQKKEKKKKKEEEEKEEGSFLLHLCLMLGLHKWNVHIF